MSDISGPDPRGSGTDAGEPAPSRSRLGELINRTDLIVALVILALVALAYYGTTLFDPVAPKLREYMVGPEAFPRLVLAIIVLLTIWLPFEVGLRGKSGEALEEDRAQKTKPISYITALMLATVVVLYTVLGTLLAMVAVCIFLPLLWGERRWKVLIPYVVLMSVVISLFFAGGLQVNFEPGIFNLEVRRALF